VVRVNVAFNPRFAKESQRDLQMEMKKLFDPETCVFISQSIPFIQTPCDVYDIHHPTFESSGHLPRPGPPKLHARDACNFAQLSAVG
jgi:hypothetical protein